MQTHIDALPAQRHNTRLADRLRNVDMQGLDCSLKCPPSLISRMNQQNMGSIQSSPSPALLESRHYSGTA